MLNFDGQIKPYNPFFEGFSHENHDLFPSNWYISNLYLISFY